MREILVLRSGPLTTIQDLGRSGLAHLGVPPSGALDRPALLLGNRLVGNPNDAAVLEITFSSFSFQALTDCVVAVTGARVQLSLDERQEAWAMPIVMRREQVLEFSLPTAGVRTYVAFNGGIEMSSDLGSRSTDLLSSLGPEPVRDGQVLALGESFGVAPLVDFAPYPEPTDQIRLNLRLGPRENYFTESALVDLATKSWQVSSMSNRIALRLEGPHLTRRDQRELKSEGIVTGSVQVPHDGLPLIFLADHPTTAGYPVIGVVGPDDVAACAQAAPGTRVSFQVIPER